MPLGLHAAGKSFQFIMDKRAGSSTEQEMLKLDSL